MLVTDQPENLPTTNELDKQSPVQGALIEAAFVKFSGTSGGALEDPPQLDEERIYIVKAICTGVNHQLRKDNEERVTVTMDIESIFEKGKTPEVNPNQGSLFVAGGTDTEDNSNDEDGDPDAD